MGSSVCTMDDDLFHCPCTPQFGHTKNGKYVHKKDIQWIYRIKNDYELAIRISKELEYYLEIHFKATGKGLHEKITSAQRNYNNIYIKTNKQFPIHLIKNMRRLATIRNKLIHNRFYNAIDDKKGFIHTFEESYIELQQIIIKMNQNKNTKSQHEQCIIL